MAFNKLGRDYVRLLSDNGHDSSDSIYITRSVSAGHRFNKADLDNVISASEILTEDGEQ